MNGRGHETEAFPNGKGLHHPPKKKATPRCGVADTGDGIYIPIYQ